MSAPPGWEWAPPLMGVAFGFAWTPCIGPVLGAILTTAAVQESGEGDAPVAVLRARARSSLRGCRGCPPRPGVAVPWLLRCHSRAIGVVLSVALISFG